MTWLPFNFCGTLGFGCVVPNIIHEVSVLVLDYLEQCSAGFSWDFYPFRTRIRQKKGEVHALAA